MNNITLVGNLVADPDSRYSQDGKPYTNFRLAVSRRFKRQGKPDTDFFRVIAYGKTAEYVRDYVKKGNRVSLSGWVELDSYEKDGHRQYTTTVNADQVNNLTPKQAQAVEAEIMPDESNLQFPNTSDDGVPF